MDRFREEEEILSFIDSSNRGSDLFITRIEALL